MGVETNDLANEAVRETICQPQVKVLGLVASCDENKNEKSVCNSYFLYFENFLGKLQKKNLRMPAHQLVGGHQHFFDPDAVVGDTSVLENSHFPLEQEVLLANFMSN